MMLRQCAPHSHLLPLVVLALFGSEFSLALTNYNFKNMCGGSISITRNEPAGIIRLQNETLNYPCLVKLSVSGNELAISLALKAIDIKSCQGSRLQIKGIGIDRFAETGKSSKNEKIIFTAAPNYCGKNIENANSSPINDKRWDTTIWFYFDPRPGVSSTAADYFEFFYQAYNITSDTSTTSTLTSTPTTSTSTATSTTSRLTSTSTTSTQTSTPTTRTLTSTPTTSTLTSTSTTSTQTSKPTTRASTSTPTTITSTSVPTSSTSTSTRTPSTSTSIPKTIKPVVALAPRARLCKCSLLVERYGKPDDEMRIDLSYVTYKFLRQYIAKSNCLDQYRCNDICQKYANANLDKGLDTLRNKFGTESAGDHVCNMLNKAVLAWKPARVTLVANARGCPGESYVKIIDYNVCCVGRIHSYRRVDCSLATKDVFG